VRGGRFRYKDWEWERRKRTLVPSERRRQPLPRAPPFDPRCTGERLECPRISCRRLLKPAPNFEPSTEETVTVLATFRGTFVDIGRGEYFAAFHLEAEGGNEDVVAMSGENNWLEIGEEEMEAGRT
jgi:hypothetical protein